MQIDPKDYDSRRLYHLLMSCVTPRPIAWVSTVSRDKIRNLAPFSYFNAVTSKRPRIAEAPIQLECRTREIFEVSPGNCRPRHR